jgi:hypothetical protein
MVAAGLRFGIIYLPDPLAACRIHGGNADFGNVWATQDTIGMWEFLLENPNFRRFLSERHANLLRAKILERRAYLSSRTGENILSGMWAGLRVPFLLAANGYLSNWKHLALPAICVLPVKRVRQGKRMAHGILERNAATSSESGVTAGGMFRNTDS